MARATIQRLAWFGAAIIAAILVLRFGCEQPMPTPRPMPRPAPPVAPNAPPAPPPNSAPPPGAPIPIRRPPPPRPPFLPNGPPQTPHSNGGGTGGAGPSGPRPRFIEAQPTSDSPAVDLPKLAIGIHANRQQLVSCYAAQSAHLARGDGRALVQFTLQPDGSVLEAHVSASDFSSPELDRCFAAQFMRWRFPPTRDGSSAQVRYPVIFAAP